VRESQTREAVVSHRLLHYGHSTSLIMASGRATPSVSECQRRSEALEAGDKVRTESTFYITFFLAALGLELRASHLLGRCF
jgi:hypothetical protein